MITKGHRQPARINGVAYGWSSLTILIGGVPVFGVTELEYSESQEADNLYGASTLPTNQGYGKIIMTGSITMYQDEFDALQKALKLQAPGYDRIQDADFDITITWTAPKSAPTKVSTHILRDVMFKDFSISSTEGDLGNTVTSELLFSEIDIIT